MLFQERNVLPDTLKTIRRSMRQGDLGSPETELLGGSRFGSSKIKRDILLGSTSNHLVDGFITDFAQEIPDGQIHNGKSGKG